MPPMALTEAQVVILYFFGTKYNYIDQSVVCVVYSFHMTYKYTLLKTGFLQLGDIEPWGIIVGAYEMIITLEPP